MDATRGVAALCVMAAHYTQPYPWGQLLPNADIAVDYFFCLSGFVIAHAYSKKLQDGAISLGGFVRTRLIRLSPMYLLGSAIGLTSTVWVSLALDLNSWRSIVIVGLFAIGLVPYFGSLAVRDSLEGHSGLVFPLNGPAWSLFFEVFVNIVYAQLRLSVAWVLVVVVLSYAWLVASTYAFGGPTGFHAQNFVGGFPRVFFSFYAGTLLHQLWRRKPSKRLNLGPLFPCFCIVAICAAPKGVGTFLLMILFACPLIVGLSMTNPRSPFLSRVFAFLGEISYPLYAIHFPMHTMAQFAYEQAIGRNEVMPIPLLVCVAMLAIFA
ncbi:MAG: acyltransferase, partial [Alphaproteobacteria bacterium]|nr:acyltransferase [Alphaproteobacteria bacterium]